MTNSTNDKALTTVGVIDASSAVSLMGQYDFQAVADNVTDEDREKYSLLTRDIRTDSPRTIQSYGQDINDVIAKQSDELLNMTNANRTSDAVVIINDLLTEIEHIQTPSQAENESLSFTGWLRKLPVVGKIVHSIDKVQVRRNTIGQNVDSMSEKITGLKATVLTNNDYLDNMAQTTCTYVKIIRERIVALMLLKKDLENEVKELEEQDVTDLDVLMQKKRSLSTTSKKITDMVSTEYLLRQNLNQIAAMEGNNNALADKADTITGHIIPIWKQQIALATINEDAKISAEIEGRLKSAFNEMIVKSADSLNKTSIDIARQAEESMIQEGTLEHSTKAFIDAIKQIKKISIEKESERANLQKRLNTFSQELNKAMTE